MPMLKQKNCCVVETKPRLLLQTTVTEMEFVDMIGMLTYQTALAKSCLSHFVFDMMFVLQEL